MPTLLLAFAVLCGAALAAESNSPRGLLVPVEGEPSQSRFIRANDTWKWTFAEQHGQRELPAGEIVRWGMPVDPMRGPVVVLADGGLLPADVRQLDNGKADLESDSLGTVRVPLEAMAGIIMTWPDAREAREPLVDRLLETEGNSDYVILANGDRLNGIVAKIDDRHIYFESNGKPTSLARDRVAAIVFHPALRNRPQNTGLHTWIGLADGTRLIAKQLVLNDQKLRLKPCIMEPNSPWWSSTTGQCVFLQPLGGRAVYLSDLTADGYRHVPFLALPWDYQNDRNVLGRQLRSGGHAYLKGLGLHSSARLTYRLDEPFDRFETGLALDDAAGKGGSVRYHIFVDGHRRFSSKPIRGGDQPTQASVDLAGAKRLDLIVDFGQRANQLDYANWLDVRLIRPKNSPIEIPHAKPRKTRRY